MRASTAILTILLGAFGTAAAAAMPQTATSSNTTSASKDNGGRGSPRVVPIYFDWHNPTCYWDLYANDRLLPGRSSPPLSGDTMTVQTCLNYCASAGYRFGGVEYGVECYCGQKRPDKKWKGSTKCDYACSGDKLAICGGAQALLMYERPCKTIIGCLDDITSNETVTIAA